MVKFDGFNRAAALFVGFRCEGLLAFFIVLLFTDECCGFQIYNKVQIRVCLSVFGFLFATYILVYNFVVKI